MRFNFRVEMRRTMTVNIVFLVYPVAIDAS